MRKRISSIILGLMFILIGVALCGKLFDLWDFNLFFDGWWTLFLIIPAVVSIVASGINLGNTIVLLIGTALLLNEQGIMDYDTIWKIFLPLLFIWIGLNIIFKSSRKYNNPKIDVIPPYNNNSDFSQNTSTTTEKNFTAIFSGIERNFNNQEFHGCTCTAIFGGIDLDLRGAIITHDVIINTTNIFGGTDLLLPSNVKCILNETPILGGSDYKFIDSTDPNAPKVIINAFCCFGGMDIK